MRFIRKRAFSSYYLDQAQTNPPQTGEQAPYLVNQRKNWLDELDTFIDQHLTEDQSLVDLAAIDLLPTSGKLSRFSVQAASVLGG